MWFIAPKLIVEKLKCSLFFSFVYALVTRLYGSFKGGYKNYGTS